MTLSRTEVRRLLGQVGAVPRKSLGQNFVVDPNTIRRIAALSGVGPGSQVVEIGAGLGSLTLGLACTGASVLAIETDPKLVGVLTEQVAPMSSAVSVLHGDARKLDWATTLGVGEWDLVANLPYNIATSLVLTLLDEVPQVRRMLVMCQREAAQRLAADVGQPGYGAVSVRVRMSGDARVVGAVPATVFWPVPAVESALVRITRSDVALSSEVADAMGRLLRQGFGRRRKMLRRSLRGGDLNADAGEVAAWLSAAGVGALARPEELGLAEWMALGKAYCAARADTVRVDTASADNTSK